MSEPARPIPVKLDAETLASLDALVAAAAYSSGTCSAGSWASGSGTKPHPSAARGCGSCPLDATPAPGPNPTGCSNRRTREGRIHTASGITGSGDAGRSGRAA